MWQSPSAKMISAIPPWTRMVTWVDCALCDSFGRFGLITKFHRAFFSVTKALPSGKKVIAKRYQKSRESGPVACAIVLASIIKLALCAKAIAD